MDKGASEAEEASGSGLNEPLLSPPPPMENSQPEQQAEAVHASISSEDNEHAPHTIQLTTNNNSSHGDEIPWYLSPPQLVAMMSNYSTSYNVVNISLVIPNLEHVVDGTTSEDVAASASSLLAGMIVGQLVGGYLGDSPVLGRLGALQLVMALQVVASLGSAMLWISSDHFYVWLAAFRFLLGMGAGGVYPLAAVLSAEQGNSQPQHAAAEENGDDQEKIHRVVLTFSCQGLGFITVPLVTVPLLYMTTNLNIVWRIILAVGSVPGLILMAAQLYIHRKHSNNQHQVVPTTDDEHEEETPATPTDGHEGGTEANNTDEEQQQHAGESSNEQMMLREMQIMEEQLRQDYEQRAGRWATIRKEPNLVAKLLGTAGTWFLFDVLFYGNTLFQPIVIDAAFGGSHKSGDIMEELRDTAIKSMILTAIALPGYAVAGIVMGKRVFCVLQTPKFVMLQGFAAMATLYLAIGTNWSPLRHQPVLLVLLYGLTFFFANYGPNTTTFILPSMVFSPKCRTTLNGISAAAGKLGALTGASLFEPVAADVGDATIMLICAGIAFLAFLMTWNFVPSRAPTTIAAHSAVLDSSS